MTKKLTSIASALTAATLLFASVAVSAAPRTVTLTVDNMYCAACPYIVKKTLERVPGVTAVDVSLAKKTAVVTFDDARTTVAALTAATAGAGYPSHRAD